jgi:DNA-binding NtrC family response regulator
LCPATVVEAAELSDLSRRMRTAQNTRPALEAELPAGLCDKPWQEARQDALNAFERMYLCRLLEQTGGRMGEAARRAGLNPRSLYEKLQRHRLSRERFRGDAEQEQARRNGGTTGTPHA